MHRLQHLIQKSDLFSRLFGIILVAAVIVCLISLPAAAETTYRITDGKRVLIFSTDTLDPADVLDEAGLELGKDDTYTTQESGEYSEIHVQRVQMVTIDNGGQILKTGTYGETVGELLQRLHITVGPDDTLSEDPEETTRENMTISISRRHYTTETYSRTIPFETKTVYDESIPSGQRKIQTVGVNGEMRMQENVVYVNNREVSRKEVSADLIREPVEEVVRVGTGASRPQEGKLTIGDGIITTEDGEILTYTRVRTMLATAYSCEGWGREGITATGTVARVGAIAVDPNVIPYGTRMFIVSNDGQYIYGVATAEDCGDTDFITGNRIDLYFNTEAECVNFGARDCQVYILG